MAKKIRHAAPGLRPASLCHECGSDGGRLGCSAIAFSLTPIPSLSHPFRSFRPSSAPASPQRSVRALLPQLHGRVWELPETRVVPRGGAVWPVRMPRRKGLRARRHHFLRRRSRLRGDAARSGRPGRAGAPRVHSRARRRAALAAAVRRSVRLPGRRLALRHDEGLFHRQRP